MSINYKISWNKKVVILISPSNLYTNRAFSFVKSIIYIHPPSFAYVYFDEKGVFEYLREEINRGSKVKIFYVILDSKPSEKE